MVLLEMSITPLGQGDSVSRCVAECVEIIDRSGEEIGDAYAEFGKISKD